jgi:hypothetical protein
MLISTCENVVIADKGYGYVCSTSVNYSSSNKSKDQSMSQCNTKQRVLPSILHIEKYI